MKRVVLITGAVVVVAAGAGALAWRVGGETAVFLMMAWGLVIALGAAPVAFGVWARRKERGHGGDAQD